MTSVVLGFFDIDVICVKIKATFTNSEDFFAFDEKI